MRSCIVFSLLILSSLFVSSCSGPTASSTIGQVEDHKDSSSELNLSIEQETDGQKILPSIAITFNMPLAGDYRVAVSGITGYEVASFEGYSDAGSISVVWKLGDMESGFYMFELFVGDFYAMKSVFLCTDPTCGGIL